MAPSLRVRAGFIADTPLPQWEVRKFAIWWLRHKPFRPPIDQAVRYYNDFAGITLYRHQQFQVQLFIVRGQRTSPWHSHPNIDSIEYGIAGSGEDTFRSERNRRVGGMIMIEPHEGHEAGAGPGGGSFISLQKWLNGVLPSSVELDWLGQPIDAEHHNQLLEF